MQTMRTALVSLLLSSVAGSALARAPEPDRVVLFKTASDDEGLAELAAAIDPIVQSALGDNPHVIIASRAAVDLPSLQLALGCVGETTDCLRAAASQSEAPQLFAPSVRRAEDGIVVTFLYFDAEHPQPIRTSERRYTGDKQGDAALSGIREMVLELFPVDDPAKRGRTEAPPTAAPDPALTAPPPAATSAPPARAGLPILPIIIGGVGVALLGTGVVFGVLSNGSLSEYEDARPSREPNNRSGMNAADEANSAFERGETQGTIANVLFGVSAGVLVGAGVLFFWQMKERPSESQVSLQPNLGVGDVGLTLTAGWNGGL